MMFPKFKKNKLIVLLFSKLLILFHIDFCIKYILTVSFVICFKLISMVQRNNLLYRNSGYIVNDQYININYITVHTMILF